MSSMFQPQACYFYLEVLGLKFDFQLANFCDFTANFVAIYLLGCK